MFWYPQILFQTKNPVFIKMQVIKIEKWKMKKKNTESIKFTDFQKMHGKKGIYTQKLQIVRKNRVGRDKKEIHVLMSSTIFNLEGK